VQAVAFPGTMRERWRITIRGATRDLHTVCGNSSRAFIDEPADRRKEGGTSVDNKRFSSSTLMV
jgi:hypothetical protein